GNPPFLRIVEQSRIRIIDVDEDSTADSEVPKSGDSAVIAAHAHMPHAPASLGADPEPDHLVVAPQGSVEKNKRAPGEARTQQIGHRRAARDKEEGFPGCCLDDLEAYRIALFA